MGNFMDKERRKSLEGLADRNRTQAHSLDHEAERLEAQVRPLELAGQKTAANRQKQAANTSRRKAVALRRAADGIENKLAAPAATEAAE